LTKQGIGSEFDRRVMGAIRKAANMGAWSYSTIWLSKDERNQLNDLGYTVQTKHCADGVYYMVSWGEDV
jgi:hypothetical protein